MTTTSKSCNSLASRTGPVLSGLRPWQPEVVEQLLQILATEPAAIDASEMGAGKTYVGAAVAKIKAVPTLVVGPKIAEASWLKAAQHFSDSLSFCGYDLLRFGNTPFGKWQNRKTLPAKPKCTICQQTADALDAPCPYHPRGIHCVELKKAKQVYGEFRFAPEIRFLIFDEVHRCGGLDSLNADLLIAARRQNIKTLMLSATPASSPIGFRAIGYALGLHNLDSDILHPQVIPSFYRWLAKYGCRRDPSFHGLHWFASQEQQQQHMLQIRASIFPAKGVRVTTDQIPNFPKRSIEAELYTLDHPDEIDSCYREMADALAELQGRADLDVAPESAITKILRARQKIELLKVPLFSELAEDYRAKGFSVVHFVNFRQTIEELSKRFPHAPIIDGQTKNRDAAVELFQSNQVGDLIVNNEAGGINLSLHDLYGGHPRVGLVSLSLSATTMRQVFGRLARDGGKTQCFYRIPLADCKSERHLHKIVVPKLNNLDALMDADLSNANIQLG